MARNNNNHKPRNTDNSGSNNGGAGSSAPQNQTPIATSTTSLLTSSNLAFGYPLGTQFTDIADLHGLDVDSQAFETVPGIASYIVEPHYGVSVEGTSALNMAAKQMYVAFTAATGRTPAYKQTDVFITAAAVQQAYAFYKFMLRAYRTVNTYSASNRYVPRTLFTAFGLDFDDFSDKLSDFAFWLDRLHRQILTLHLPTKVAALYEFADAISDVYMDSDATYKAQLVAMTPAYFLKYDPTFASVGSCLIPKPWLKVEGGARKLYTFEEVQAYADDLIGILVYDSDINRIMNDIYLLLGEQSVLTLEPVNLGETLTYKYDPLVLETLHNATIHGSTITENGVNHGVTLERSVIGDEIETSDLPSAGLYQTTAGQLIHRPAFMMSKQNALAYCGGVVLDVQAAEVSPATVLLMSRMMTNIPDIETSIPSKLTTDNKAFYKGGIGTFGMGPTVNVVPKSIGFVSVANLEIYTNSRTGVPVRSIIGHTEYGFVEGNESLSQQVTKFTALSREQLQHKLCAACK